jgi:hypothetical protein
MKMNFQELLKKIETWIINLNWICAVILLFLIPLLFAIPLILVVLLLNFKYSILQSCIINIPRQDYVYYYIYFMTMIVNGTLSYMIYKITKTNNNISKESFKLQKKLADNELERKNYIVKENALVIYHDFHFGLITFIKLYAFYCQSNQINSVSKRIYISNEWITKVATLSRDEFLIGNIIDMYTLYEGLSNINEVLYDYNYSNTNKGTLYVNISNTLEDLKNKIFISNIVIDINNGIKYKGYLDNTYSNILKRLKYISNEEYFY